MLNRFHATPATGRPATNGLAAAFLLALVTLSACSGGGSTGEFALIPSAVTVMEGDLKLPEGSVLASTRALFGVVAAVRDGKRIVVLTSKGRTALMTWHPPASGCSTCGGTIGSAGGGTTGYELFVSDDEGVHWRGMPVGRAGLETVGLAAWEGRLVMIDYRFEPSDGLADRGYYQLREVDPSSGNTLPNRAIDGQEFFVLSPFLAVGSRLTFFTFDPLLTEDAGAYVGVRYDFTDDTLRQVRGPEVRFTGGALSRPIVQTSFQTPWHTLDGEVFSGLAQSADLRYAAGAIFPSVGVTGMCWRKGLFTDPPQSTATDCLDFSALPPEMHDTIGPARTASGLVELATHDGRGFALPLSEPFSADRLIALGEGGPSRTTTPTPAGAGSCAWVTDLSTSRRMGRPRRSRCA